MQIFIFLHLGEERAGRKFSHVNLQWSPQPPFHVFSLLSSQTQRIFGNPPISNKFLVSYRTTSWKQSNLSACKFSDPSSVKQPEGSAMPINCNRGAIKILYAFNSQYTARIESRWLYQCKIQASKYKFNISYDKWRCFCGGGQDGSKETPLLKTFRIVPYGFMAIFTQVMLRCINICKIKILRGRD